MPLIKGGRVAYKQTVQPQPYESESAEVEVTFSLEDGEELGAEIATIFEELRAEVLIALRLKKRKAG